MINIYTTLLALLISIPVHSQITEELVLFYDLNGDALDRSPYENHGIPINTSPVSNMYGEMESAVYFDGTAKIILPNNSIIKPPLPITISLFIKLDVLNQTQPLYHSDVVPDDYVGFFINAAANGQIMAHLGSHLGGSGPHNRRSFLSDKMISAGNWHHIAVILNSYDNMRIFIDCIESSGTYSGYGNTTLVYSTTKGRIGEGASNPNFPYGFFLKGAMDEVSLWNRALVESEIKGICEGTIPTDETTEIKITIYPIPSNTDIQISVERPDTTTELRFVLYNSIGQIVRTGSSSENCFTIKRNGLRSGMYYLTLDDDISIKDGSKVVFR